MADNIEVTAGTGTVIAADDIASVLYQRVKIALGADGAATDALGGAGAVAGGVQRVTLASDDPAVVALQIMDDWDESDRAKVNPIAGQAGVAAGAGAVDALTQRVILATDDVVAALSKAEDAAHSSGHTGIVPLAVRRDAKAVGSGTDGDYSTLNVSADGDLRVDGGKAFIVRVTPTITVPGTAYVANDCFGGEMTITAAGRVSGGSGILTGITMSFEDDIAASTIEVLIFDSNPAGTYTDNTALAVSDADTYLLLGSVILDVKTDLGDGALLKATNVNIPYVCNGSADIFAVAVIRTSVPTPTATDAAQFTFHMVRD